MKRLIEVDDEMIVSGAFVRCRCWGCCAGQLLVAVFVVGRSQRNRKQAPACYLLCCYSTLLLRVLRGNNSNVKQKEQNLYALMSAVLVVIVEAGVGVFRPDSLICYLVFVLFVREGINLLYLARRGVCSFNHII